jgi:hypothetical protein
MPGCCTQAAMSETRAARRCQHFQGIRAFHAVNHGANSLALALARASLYAITSLPDGLLEQRSRWGGGLFSWAPFSGLDPLGIRKDADDHPTDR